MNWSHAAFLTPYVVSLLIATTIAVYCWQHRATVGAVAFALVLLSETAWILGYIFELLSPGLQGKVFWDNVQFFGTFGVPIALLAFARDYAGRPLAHPRRTLGLVSVFPLLFMIFVFVDPMHLLRPDAHLILSSLFSELSYSFTPAFYIATAYIYVLILYSLGVLVLRVVRAQPMYRGQLGLVTAGMLIPTLGGVLTLAGFQLGPHRDISPFTFALGNLLVAWALFRYRLFDLMPVARDKLVESMSDIVIVIDAADRVVDLNPAARQVVGGSTGQMIGAPLADVFPNQRPIIERYGDLDELATEIVTEDPSGMPVQLDLRISGLYDQGGHLTGRLIVARDITDRKRVEAAESEQRNLAEALIDITRAINSTLEVDEVLERILENVGKVVPHTRAEILLVSSGVARLVGSRSDGADTPPQVLGIRGPVDEVGPLRHMAESRQALVIADRRADLPPAFPGADWIRSYIGAPIVTDGQVIGFVNLANTQPGFYTDIHAARLQAFADQAAIAIENARLYTIAQAAAVSEERQRLAREIHDNVSQTIFAASSIAELLSRITDCHSEKFHSYVDELGGLIQVAMAELRALMLELQPDVLAQTELGALIRLLCNIFTASTQIAVRVAAADRLVLRPEAQIAFYRIAQEALDNVRQHARASHVDVTLERVDGRVTLRIKDDGCGFNVEAADIDGSGIATMRNHAASADAGLTITSSAGAGTEVVLREA